MTIATEKTVRELALESPASTRVFEKLGIDYCCGGNKSLEEACHASNLKIDQVLDSLNEANQAALVVQTEQTWNAEPLASLIGHIQSTHHKYTRDEIARLCPLLEKVCSVHGKNHPELFEAAGNALRAMKRASNGFSAPTDGCISYQTLYKALAAFEADLHQHIHLENNILFPRAVALEKAR
jgi:regulator of cell morphogenesis and NO signaling